MDASLRSTPSLLDRINNLQKELMRRYGNITEQAGIERTDRNSSATAQFQMQVDTAGLIRAAEDLQTLIRQLQEMWLFGQLKTLGHSTTQQQTDETAKEVAQLLQNLAGKRQAVSPNGSNLNGENGDMMDGS